VAAGATAGAGLENGDEVDARAPKRVGAEEGLGAPPRPNSRPTSMPSSAFAASGSLVAGAGDENCASVELVAVEGGGAAETTGSGCGSGEVIGGSAFGDSTTFGGSTTVAGSTLGGSIAGGSTLGGSAAELSTFGASALGGAPKVMLLKLMPPDVAGAGVPKVKPPVEGEGLGSLESDGAGVVVPKEKPPAGAPPNVNPEEVIAPPTTGFGAGFSDGGRPAIKDKQH